MGPTQLRLLRLAAQGPIKATTAQERASALKLHDHGYFDRGPTSSDYRINEKGRKRHGEEQQKDAA